MVGFAIGIADVTVFIKFHPEFTQESDESTLNLQCWLCHCYHFYAMLKFCQKAHEIPVNLASTDNDNVHLDITCFYQLSGQYTDLKFD